MAASIQVKRGVTAKVAAYTPLSGELVLDTTTNKLYAGDGSTTGGNQIVGSQKGVTDASDAAAGQIGEYVTAQSTAAAITTGTPANTASLTLSAGDWDVQGLSEFAGASGCIPTQLRTEISPSSAAFVGFGQGTLLNATFATASTNRQDTNVVRISVSAATTIYVVVQSVFSGGTMTARAYIRARRAR